MSEQVLYHSNNEIISQVCVEVVSFNIQEEYRPIKIAHGVKQQQTNEHRCPRTIAMTFVLVGTRWFKWYANIDGRYVQNVFPNDKLTSSIQYVLNK